MPSQPWCQQRLTAFDCETTGVDPRTARIVIGCVAYVGGGLDTETVQVLADPGVEIPAEATAVHGVTTERARAEGLPAAAAVAIVLEAIAGRPDGSAVICFNAPYDLTVLEHEAKRHNLQPLSARGPLLVVDPLVLDKHLDRYRKGSRKLLAICQHYGVRIDAAHDASYDAIAAARLAYWLCTTVDVWRRGRGADEVRDWVALRREWDEVRHSLPKLHAAQIRWAAEQAAGLEAHFTAKDEAQPIAREWPVAA